MEMSYLKWEYKKLTFDLLANVEGTLNPPGKQGWELVAVIPFSRGESGVSNGLAFFKRKKEKKD
jgi:hypothetical protein